jgi:hypothetical protein
MEALISRPKNFLGLFILTLISTISSADWIKFDESETFTYYYDSIDFSTNRIKRNRACDSPGCTRIYWEENSPLQKKWILINYSQARSGAVNSSRALLEFNCNKLEYRIIALTNFIQPMGKGEVLAEVEDGSIKKLDSLHEEVVFKYFEKICKSKTNYKSP